MGNEGAPENLFRKDLKLEVNKAFELLESTTRYKRVKENVPGSEGLRGKRITMVDDVKTVLEGFVEDLVVASDGNASFILHADQPVEELIAEILASDPDVVLVDGHLAKGIQGNKVVEFLLQSRPDILPILFSSDTRFAQAAGVEGVITSVNKDSADPEASVQQIAAVVEKAAREAS